MKFSFRLTASVLFAFVLLALMTDNTDLKKTFSANLEIPSAGFPDDAPVRPTRSANSPRENPAPRANAAPPVLATPATENSASPKIPDNLSYLDATLAPSNPLPPDKPGETLDLFVHLPPDATLKQPLRVVVALHGVGARGDAFAQRLIADANRNGWVLIAPTFPYRDHMDMRSLLDEDIFYTRLLNNALTTLPRRLGIRLRQHVLLYGFSRGGQLAHRFALFYPERVASVATLSAGTYTLPLEKRTQNDATQILVLPFGIGDLKDRVGHSFDTKQFGKISFWVAVGGNDDRVSDVPRAFDDYVGRNRVQRAAAFSAAVKQIGGEAHFAAFPNVGHEVTNEMHQAAIKFLRDDELFDKLND